MPSNFLPLCKLNGTLKCYNLKKILFILFALSQVNRVNCIHCGKFGFSCINERYYRNCDVYKKSYVGTVINMCPKNSFCNERVKRACSTSHTPPSCSSPSSSGGNPDHDKEIDDIMSTEFPNKYPTKKPTTRPTTRPAATATATSTSCSSSSSSSCSNSVNPSSLSNNDKKIQKPPSPIKAEKNAKSSVKSKSNFTKMAKAKGKHVRDVWGSQYNGPYLLNLENRQYKQNPNGKLASSGNLNDDYSELFANPNNEDDSNENKKYFKFRYNNPKNNKQFICPSVGSFPIESDDTCFYVCLNRRRSLHNELKAIKVYCPKTMYFNKKSHRCENRNFKYSNNNWQRRRLNNRKFQRQRTFDRNRFFS